MTLKNPETMFCWSSVRLSFHCLNSYKIVARICTRYVLILFSFIWTHQYSFPIKLSISIAYHLVHVRRVEVCTRRFLQWKCCFIFQALPPTNWPGGFRKQLYCRICSSQICFIFIKGRPVENETHRREN